MHELTFKLMESALFYINFNVKGFSTYNIMSLKRDSFTSFPIHHV